MDRLQNIKGFFFMFVMLFASLTSFAEDILVKKDLRLDWVFYDEQDQVMLPFLDNSSEFPIAIHLSISPDHGAEAYLVLNVPAGTSLFLENKFVKQYEEDSKPLFLLDSLGKAFGSKVFQLTLYNKKSFQNPLEAQIGFKYNSFDAETRINPIAKRTIDKKSEFLKIIILVLFAFFVVLKTLFPSDLFEFLSLRTLVTFRYTDTLISKYRSITKTQTLVIVYQAALLSGLLIVFINYYSNPFDEMKFLSANPLIGWMSLFGMMLILFILKYILISVLSLLFGMADRTNFYFLEFLRMSMVFYTVLFLIVGYAIINKFYLVENLLDSLIILIIGFNLLRFLILYFKFRATVPMKNLHLFSYLCTTELIPIILGVRFFIK